MGEVGTDSSKTSYSLDWRSRPARNPADPDLGLARTHTSTTFPATAPSGGNEETLSRSCIDLAGRDFLRIARNRLRSPPFPRVPRGTTRFRPRFAPESRVLGIHHGNQRLILSKRCSHN